MLKNPLTITIKGKDFLVDEIYKCLFHPAKNSSEYLRYGYLDNLVTALYISGQSLKCHVPLSV
jgi:hypothetical protein